MSSSNPVEKPPSNGTNASSKWKWREWHEREVPVKVSGYDASSGIRIDISSEQITRSLELIFPEGIWEHYPQQNKVKFIENVTYLFTAHLPFLLKT